MNKFASISSPGKLTVLAALLAGLAAPAIAADPATHLVISQVYGGGSSGGAAYYKDFIELFNPTSSPISLNGKSVQYGSTGGTALSGVFVLPNVTLQPGQYFLVGGSGATGTASTPAPDAISTLSMAAGAGKAVLIEGTALAAAATPGSANVIDWVGYGSGTNAFEGSGPTPTTSIANSVYRTAACFDSNDNATEFTAAAVAPRNSATPLAACGAAGAPAAIVTTCPANAAFVQGAGGSTALTAKDDDSIVNGATITSSAVPGITLEGFNASSAAGANASVNLTVAASTALGTYPVTVNFVNGDGQQASCTVSVAVQPLAATSRRIFEIQGNGAKSPYAGTVQTVEGVVTAKVGSGFFIQDAAGDGDPTTSDAIFVFNSTALASIAVNDIVRVTATVTEFTPTGAANSVTELTNATAIAKQGVSNGIAPTNLTLPVADFGPYQGMLVRFTQSLTASQTEFLGDRGEVTLSAGRLEVPTNRYRAGTPEALALAAANAKNMIILDDGLFVTPTTIPYIGADQTIRLGDTALNVTGVIDFGAKGGGGAAYKLQPTQPVSFSRDNPRPAAPSYAAGNVKVASANVLNFFTTFTNGTSVFDQSSNTQGCSLGSGVSKNNCRGADNLNEFNRQRDKIVNALKLIDADVFGLMEIQNSGETTVSYLVNQLNAAYGSTVYAVVPKPPATGTDAIRVAMIYKPSKLTLVGSALSDSDSVNNRPPMAQTFQAANGGKFSLIVNHLKSKGSCPSSGEIDSDGQGCWNATRVRQTTRLRDYFIPLVKSASGDNDVLLIGDFNAHGMEDPINLLTDTAGIVNELERYVRPLGFPYSFVFDGESGYLDHALTTPSMSAQVSGASEFHNNADEPTVIDYNTDGKPQDLYVNNAYRASDHDPVIISLNLAGVATYTDVSGSFSTYRSALANARGSSTYTGNITLTNTSNAAVTGPVQLELQGLPSGVTLSNATGMHNGVPYITVSAGPVAAGANVVVNLVFSNPSKGPMGYTTTISSGTF